VIPFIVAGLVSGSVYGLAGVGVVLTYKTSGIFNFAYGAIGTLAVYVFYFLWVQEHLPWAVAAVIVLAVVGVLGGCCLELLARRLASVIPALQVVATVGIILIVEATATIWHGVQPVPIPQYLPTWSLRAGGVNIGFDQIVIFTLALLSSIALFVYFKVSRSGMAMRAVVDNPDLVDLVGTNPARIRRTAWVLGTTFAALTGILLAPSIGLNATLLSLLVIQAFGVAAIGHFSNLPLTYLGGLIVGVAASVVTKYVSTGSWLGGLPASLPFLVLVVVLVVTPRARLTLRRAVPPTPLHQPWHAPPRVRAVGGVIATIVFVLVPTFVGTELPVWTTFLAYVLLFLSLGLLVKTTGQISLCHLGLMAIGAAAFAHFAGSFHIPWLLAVLLAGVVVVPIGALIAGTAIRLSGVFLALATLGFGVFLEQMMYTTNWMFGTTATGIVAPRPGVSWLQSTRQFYWLVLAIVVVTVTAITILSRLRLGRLLRALADSPAALETQGVPVSITRLWVFGISAFLAGIAGAVYGSELNYVGGGSFTSFGSLTAFVLVVLAVGAEPWFALIAAAGLVVIPAYITLGNITEYMQILFGISAVAMSMLQDRPPRIPLRIRALLERMGGTAKVPALQGAVAEPTMAPDGINGARRRPALRLPAAAVREPDPAAMAESIETVASERRGLQLRNLTVRYGGLVAVDNLSLEARMGRTTGLIGPNGAGKTSAFSAATGLVRPAQGSVHLHGTDVTGLRPWARAQQGLGRTFQQVSIFPSLTVLENISMGGEAIHAGGSPTHQLVGRRGEGAVIAERARDAADLVGISSLLPLLAGTLSTGQKRLVELARAVAGGLDVLLLDEPSSGLDETETARFGETLLTLSRQRQLAILLVEHDMSLVLGVCEYIYVMEFGQLIFSGTRDEVTTSSVVRAAYLGTELDHIVTA
jgi:ABC-type branched-subunit amino acid transport system ATPase component/branched-subunit amino acid ABC-type transport system permease component